MRGRTGLIIELPTTSSVIKKIAAVKWNIHHKNWTKTTALYSNTKAHKIRTHKYYNSKITILQLDIILINITIIIIIHPALKFNTLIKHFAIKF